jgi:hypothetical protein
MAELLAVLNHLQTRFAPFLERYRHFMVEDPIIPQEVRVLRCFTVKSEVELSRTCARPRRC